MGAKLKTGTKFLSFFILSHTMVFLFSSCEFNKNKTPESFDVKQVLPSEDTPSSGNAIKILFLETKNAGFVPPDIWFASECVIKTDGFLEFKLSKSKKPTQSIIKNLSPDLIEEIKVLIDEIVESELATVNHFTCYADGPLHETKVLTSKDEVEYIHQIIRDFSSGGCQQINVTCEGTSTDKLYEIINNNCKI